MKKQTFTIPVWALNYLANGDKSGLTLEDLALCQHFERQNKIAGFLPSDGEYFPSQTNAIDFLAGMCAKATFHVRYTSDELFNRIVCRVDGKYGAPMGRDNNNARTILTTDDWTGEPSEVIQRINWNSTPHFDRRIPLDSGGCDRGGCYFGLPTNTLRVKMSKDGQFWEFYRS